jgi:hypothetical protein
MLQAEVVGLVLRVWGGVFDASVGFSLVAAPLLVASLFGHAPSVAASGGFVNRSRILSQPD